MELARLSGMAARKRRGVVVTGASAGVGRATSRRFAVHGDAVALLAHRLRRG